MDDEPSESLQNSQINLVNHINQLNHLNQLDHDGVNISCINSTDFVVGKQTNFNGPVTIINCPTHPTSSPLPQRLSPVDSQRADEQVVIKDKVLTASVTNTIHSHAQSCKQRGSIQHFPPTSKPSSPASFPLANALLHKNFMRVPLLAWAVGSAVFLACIVVVAVQLTRTKEGVVREGATTISGPNGTEHQMLSKSLWGGVKPKSVVQIQLPVQYVVISHTSGGTCADEETCSQKVRAIQQLHMSGAYADIAYSFLVGGDGNIYEGRGWYVRSAVGSFANNKNVDINFIGDFSVVNVPTPAQFDGVRALILYGVAEGKISPQYSLIAANTTYQSLSPGKNVYREIKMWEHFDSDPVSHIPQPKGDEG